MNAATRITRMPAASSALQTPPAQVARFSVERYHALLASGLLTENDRFELLHGWIVQKMTINPAHATCVRKLNRLLSRIVTDDSWVIGCQTPITLTASEPEPDLFIATGPEERYESTHPTAKDVAVLIEVADSSLELDRTTKFELYAAAKIPVYWIVNLVDRCVEVFTQPRGGRSPTYKMQESFTVDCDVPLVVRGQVLGSIPVREFLP